LSNGEVCVGLTFVDLRINKKEGAMLENSIILLPFVLVSTILFVAVLWCFLFTLDRRMNKKDSHKFYRICGANQTEVTIKVRFLGQRFLSWFERETWPENTKSPECLKSYPDILVTKLADVYAKMSKQPNGEAGDLFVDGQGNEFHVFDKSNMLRTVVVHFENEGNRTGWCVNAYV
jgi:hypothetical protein